MTRLIGFLILLIVVVAIYPALLLMRSTATEIQLQTPVKVVGVSTPVRLVALNSHGVRELSATIDQGGKSYRVFEHAEPAQRWSLLPTRRNPQSFEFEIGSKKAPGLHDGNAVLRIEAVSNDLRARRDTMTLELDINTKPPSLSVDEGQHYINLGGAEVVTFTTAGYVTDSGVRVGKHIFRSFPLPGGQSPARRICFFAFPHDTPEGDVPIVFARNPAGAEATSRFWYKLTRKKFRTRDINLTDGFLKKIFDELDPRGSGNMEARFVKINNDMRIANNSVLAELRNQTSDQILWNGPFTQLANSSVEAQFCDYRRYLYHGAQIDEQVHLGFDLAVTAKTPVLAANDGKVIHAAPLGIYGNAIVVDHGMAIQSLYAHLSLIEVKPGDSVKKGQPIGRSGATGLAGGDHLHFSIQIEGIPVNPVEWWDAHWLKDRVLSKLPQ
jgi:hypothetical protein